MKIVKPTAFPANPMLGTAHDLGAAVRCLRTESGLTLQTAAAALGAAKQTLQNLERGDGNVSMEFALRAARELGVVLFMARAEDAERIRRRITESD